MKLIMFVFQDGSAFPGPRVDVDFNTQAWAEDRKTGLRLLGVVRIVEHML